MAEVDGLDNKRWWGNMVSMAVVSDEEWKKDCSVGDVPTVDGLLRLLDKAGYKVGRYELLADIVELNALAIANRLVVVKNKLWQDREDEYKRIMNKYSDDVKELIYEMSAGIYEKLSTQYQYGFGDWLGELFMKSETSNGKAGQFFTPYHVSKAVAELNLRNCDVDKFIKNDEIIKIHEPSVGAGGMVIAVADVLYNKYRFNIARNLFVECGDIDKRCVLMTYLQLSLAGIPAVVYHRDGLTLQTWGRWETPALVLQWLRFKDLVGG